MHRALSPARPLRDVQCRMEDFPDNAVRLIQHNKVVLAVAAEVQLKVRAATEVAQRARLRIVAADQRISRSAHLMRHSELIINDGAPATQWRSLPGPAGRCIRAAREAQLTDDIRLISWWLLSAAAAMRMQCQQTRWESTSLRCRAREQRERAAALRFAVRSREHAGRP